MIASSVNPTVGDAVDRDLHSDWQVTIPATTDAGDRIIFAIGIQTDTPELQADNLTGNLTGTDASLVTVTRISSTSVSVTVRAKALRDFLGYGSYEYELKTIRNNATTLKYRASVSFRSGVSKVIA